MDKLVLNIKDESKLDFLIQLLKQFNFVDILKETKQKKQDDKYNFFLSAGLWKNRTIDANELRQQAWNRQK